MSPTNAERAYAIIRRKTVTLDLPPGAVIDESSLMEELGLGRTPIREALKQLQTDNLVIIKPRRGIFVAEIAITDLTQIHEVRIELEAACARFGAQRITPAQLGELKTLLQECQQTDGTDMAELMHLDRRFHALLAQATHNKFLVKDWENYYDLSQRIWYLAINALKPGDLGLDDHAGIASAVKAGDGERAEQIMRDHIIHFQETIKHCI